MFRWIRQQVKAAVLAGCEDALAELGDGEGRAAEALRERLTPQLPAHEPEPEAANGKSPKRERAVRP